MRAGLRWSAAFAGLYLLMLLLTLPPAQLLRFVPAPVRPERATGTLWHGTAEGLRLGRAAIQRLAWRWRPAALLRGRLEYRLFFQTAAGGGELRAGRPLLGTPYVADVRARFGAGELAGWLGLPGGLGGMLDLDLAEARFQAGRPVAVRGEITWKPARLLQPVALDLGGIYLQLTTPRPAHIQGQLQDTGGPLEIRARLHLDDGAYRIDGQLRPRPQAPADLVQNLGLLGAADAQGRYRLHYAGRL